MEVTDIEMLLSEAYRNYLERIVRAQSGNFKLQVEFGKWPQTDGKTIWLKPDVNIYDGLSLAHRTLCVMGNLAHEFSHIRWTNFEDYKEYMGNLSLSSFEKIVIQNIANIVEDSFIEAAALNYYKGVFAAGIRAKNEVFFAQHPSQEELFKKRKSKLDMALAAMLEDAKYHRRKTESPDPEVEEWFQKTRPLWLKVLETPKTKDRLNIAKEIYHSIPKGWLDAPSDIRPDFSHYGWDRNNAGEPDESLMKRLSQMKQELELEEGEPSQEEGESSQKEVGSSPDQGESQEQGESPKEAEEYPVDQSPAGQSPNENEKESSKDEEILQNLEKDLEGVREEEQKNREAKKKVEDQLSQLASQLELSELHRGIRLEVVIQNQTPFRSYESYMDGLREKIRLAEKKIKDLIRTNEDWKMRSSSGRIWQNSLHRADKKIFYRRKEKSEEKDLALVLLIDESGSMYDRTDSMIQAGIFFMELAERLNIPYAVYGHSAVYGTYSVEVRVYKDFDDPREAKKRILNIAPMEGTRDGPVLEWISKRMAQRGEKDKILISITDGVPHHRTPRGKDPYPAMAMQDTASFLKKLEREGILVIGLCIGKEAEPMRELYRESIDIPDIAGLPAELFKILRKNIFKASY